MTLDLTTQKFRERVQARLDQLKRGPTPSVKPLQQPDPLPVSKQVPGLRPDGVPDLPDVGTDWSWVMWLLIGTAVGAVAMYVLMRSTSSREDADMDIKRRWNESVPGGDPEEMYMGEVLVANPEYFGPPSQGQAPSVAAYAY